MMNQERNEFFLELENFKIKLDSQEDMLESKSSIKDVCALVDTKANSNDVFKVLDEMKKSIQFLTNQKSNDNGSSRMFDSFLREQKFINENLCPLNCVAQYVWYGGFGQAPIFDSLLDKSTGKSSF